MSEHVSPKLSGQELADWLSLSEGRVTQLKDSGVFIRDKDGKYDLRVSVQAYCQSVKHKGSNPLFDEEAGLTFDNYTQRKAYYDSEAKKDEILENRRHLFPAETVQECFFSLVEQARESFLILPDIIERDSGASPKVISSIEKNVNKILNGLANEGERVRRELGATS